MEKKWCQVYFPLNFYERIKWWQLRFLFSFGGLTPDIGSLEIFEDLC